MSTGAPFRGRVLVIEDDQACAQVLREALTAEGYQVVVASTGAQAEARLAEAAPDIILLDIILPDVDGLVLCWRIRQRRREPIILVSGTRRRSDRTLGLALGADDFLPKPFEVTELIAHVEAVLRRVWSSEQTGGQQRVGGLVIDRTRLMVQSDDRVLPLTPTEFRLLAHLASRPDQALSRAELAEAAWGSAHVGRSRAVDTHMLRLRLKLRDGGHQAARIATVRGVGYKLLP